MSKYKPLETYLRESGRESVPMTFDEIKRIIGARLPRSSRYRAWWSNHPLNNTMTDAWRRAGYKTENVDMASRKLVFRKSAM